LLLILVLNFFTFSSFSVSNFGGKEKVLKQSKSRISLLNLFEMVGALFFTKKAYQENPSAQVLSAVFAVKTSRQKRINFV